MGQNIFQKRIKAWEKQYGKLAPELLLRIEKLVDEYDKKQTLDRENKALRVADGTRLIREFKGQRYAVLVIQDGFEFNGRKYKSLSAIANEITGTRWNGKKFFGVA